MKRIVLLAITSLILLLTLVAALAAPHSETPNDPRVNPDANACYRGGSMAGKCKLDDELWIAGWYESAIKSIHAREEELHITPAELEKQLRKKQSQ